MSGAVTPERIHSQARGDAASQATVIEQSRAIAEVQGALVVAQQRPRDVPEAIRKALESCRTKEVAEGAFYKYTRGGATISDASIHLAAELARVWGNVIYGIAELARDDSGAKSEMLAYAWDLETNTRVQTGFIVPHYRDKTGGPARLTDMRDIYENNANQGARRLRECIFRILPPHLKEQAKAACFKTLQGDGMKPLAQLVAEAITAFEQIGISRARIEAKHGPMTKMTEIDVANLAVSHRSIVRKEVDADEEFPRVGTEEATKAARRVADRTKGAAETVTEDSPPAEEGKPDEDRGEAHSDAEAADEEDQEARYAARAVANEISKAYGIAGNIIDLGNLKAARAADIEALPDDIRDDLDAAYRAAETKLKGGK